MASTIYQVLAEHYKARDGEYAIPLTIRTKSGDKIHGVMQNWQEHAKIVQIRTDTAMCFVEIESIESVKK